MEEAKIRLLLVVSKANSPVTSTVGLAPFGMAQFRFDHDPDPVNWLDPAKKSSVELNIQTRDAASAASGINAVILDLFKRY